MTGLFTHRSASNANLARKARASLFDTRAATQKRRHYLQQARQRARSTLDAFAERLAEHGNVARAAAEIGKSESYGRVLLGRIKRGLGSQAI